MMNPFKEIETHKTVSPELKKKVMNEIQVIALATEVGDLFTFKFASVFEDLFRPKKSDQKK